MPAATNVAPEAPIAASPSQDLQELQYTALAWVHSTDCGSSSGQ